MSFACNKQSLSILIAVIFATVAQAADDVVIGTGASTTGTTSSVVIGDSATNVALGGYNVLIGASAQTGNWSGSNWGAIAIGGGSIAGGNSNNIAIGTMAEIGLTANVNTSIAFGTGAKVIEGSGGVGTVSAVAIGTGSIANQSYTVSFGDPSQNVYRRLVNLSDGVNARDAVTVQQMQAALAGAGGTTDQIARDAAAAAQATADSASSSVAALTPRVTALESTVAGQGAGIASALSTANTARSEAAAAQGTADMARTEAAAARTVADDAWTLADTGLQMSMSLSTRIDAIETTSASTHALASDAYATASRAEGKADNALAGVDRLSGQVDALDRRLSQVETGVAGVIAMSSATTSAAISAMRSQRGIGLGFGAGSFAGRTQAALSLSGTVGRVQLSASASLSSRPATQVGLGFAF